MKAGNHNGGAKQKMIQQLLLESDHYVFIFPVWWASMPAILKNFFDVNFSAGFAFEFVSGKAMPKKLLAGKTAELIYHSDAPAFLYKCPLLSGINIRKHIANSILGFCGVKTTKVLAIGGLRNKSEAEKKKILEKVS
jgi:putative NADPH-quinone reductase